LHEVGKVGRDIICFGHPGWDSFAPHPKSHH
jgi:hypothetical protein